MENNNKKWKVNILVGSILSMLIFWSSLIFNNGELFSSDPFEQAGLVMIILETITFSFVAPLIVQYVFSKVNNVESLKIKPKQVLMPVIYSTIALILWGVIIIVATPLFALLAIVIVMLT